MGFDGNSMAVPSFRSTCSEPGPLLHSEPHQNCLCNPSINQRHCEQQVARHARPCNASLWTQFTLNVAGEHKVTSELWRKLVSGSGLLSTLAWLQSFESRSGDAAQLRCYPPSNLRQYQVLSLSTFHLIMTVGSIKAVTLSVAG